MASRGYLSCLKYLVDNGFNTTSDGLAAAIYDGPHMDVIKYAVEVLNVSWSSNALREVVQKNNVELLKYAYKTGGEKYMDGWVADHAARNGSIECLKFMKEIKVKFHDSILNAAASSGSLECIKFLHQTRAFKLKPSAETCAAAAKAGSLEVLKYCHENGGPWDEETIHYACENGHIACVEYAIQNNAPVDADVSEVAMGHYDCLKAVYQYLGEWPEDMSWYIPKDNADPVECFQYAHENGAPWNEDTCENAARTDAVNCLKYAHENGATWNDDICAYAARHGAIKCLKYLRENGVPWTAKECQEAAYENHLECLIYCHENGAPWDSDSAWSAARHPTIDCLKYCHEHGCPWDSWTLGVAARNSGMACLKYAVENGCPRGDEVCKMCHDSNVLKYLHENEICTCQKK